MKKLFGNVTFLCCKSRVPRKRKKFARIDTAKRYIYLTDNKGEEYLFDIKYSILSDTKNTWLQLYFVDITKGFSAGIGHEFTTPLTAGDKLLSQATTIAIIDSQLAVNPGTISIRWNDERNLTQIEQQHLQDPTTPLNAAQPENTVVMELAQPPNQTK